MAGLTVPPGTRCLLADVAGVGRDYPLSMEKLSPILAFYVVDGLKRARSEARKCWVTAAWAIRPEFTRARVKRQ